MAKTSWRALRSESERQTAKQSANVSVSYCVSLMWPGATSSRHARRLCQCRRPSRVAASRLTCWTCAISGSVGPNVACSRKRTTSACDSRRAAGEELENGWAHEGASCTRSTIDGGGGGDVGIAKQPHLVYADDPGVEVDQVGVGTGVRTSQRSRFVHPVRVVASRAGGAGRPQPWTSPRLPLSHRMIA